MQKLDKPVQLSEYGKRMGETHGRAKLTDHEIDLVRQLKEEGMPAPEIAEKMEISKRYVYKLVNFERRACVIAEYRTRRIGRKKDGSKLVDKGPDASSGAYLPEINQPTMEDSLLFRGKHEDWNLPKSKKRKDAC